MPTDAGAPFVPRRDPSADADALPPLLRAQLQEQRLAPDFIEPLLGLAVAYGHIDRALTAHPTLVGELLDRVSPELDRLYEHLWAAVAPLNDDPAEARRKAAHLQVFRAVLNPYLQRAEIHRRALHKPRGYPGDYLLMDYVYGAPLPPEDAFAQLLSRHFLAQPGPRAVRSRCAYLLSALQRSVRAARGPLRVLSVGAGPARELQELLRADPWCSVEITLLDRDSAALDHARSALCALPGVSDPLCLALHVKEVLRGALRPHGPFDLIYAAGLYDYLRQGFAIDLTLGLLGLLAPNGELIIANLACDPINPSRPFIEYAHDWFLLYRDEWEMRGLVGDSRASAHLGRDAATGTVLFLHARPGDAVAPKAVRP